LFLHDVFGLGFDEVAATLNIEDGRIVGVYIVRNPEKLRYLADLSELKNSV
jgi:hypothetical protein